MNLEVIYSQANQLVLEVGAFIKEESKKFATTDIKEKSKNSLVTYVDTEAEIRLVKGLSKVVPEAGFITEEKTAKKSKGEKVQWIIDPLDGTTNFIHGIPCYSVSVALMEGPEVVLGIVYEINMDECFHAWKGSGAFLNKSPIHVSPPKNLDESLLATGFPYHDYERIDAYMETFKTLMLSSRGIRRLGSAAVDLAYVACGRFDAFYEYSLNSWDVAAGSIIVEEAGGKVTDFKGGTNHIFGKEILASSLGIYNDLQVILQQEMKGSSE